MVLELFNNGMLKFKLFSTDRLVLYSLENEGIPLFFQHYDSVYVPTLRLVHKCKLCIYIGYDMLNCTFRS